jgi:hypothetical protein
MVVADSATLAAMNLSIDVSALLLDALVVDLGSFPETFWFIEAVATDGPIDEDSKRSFINWPRRTPGGPV